VRNAIAHGGGWVQFFFHRVCPDDCDEYSWTPASLDAFLTWLEQQRTAGALDVRTMRDVLHPAFHPKVDAPAPPAPRAAPTACATHPSSAGPRAPRLRRAGSTRARARGRACAGCTGAPKR
jgi:hypothetical protein